MAQLGHRTATLRDVARAAGVSPATVSKALNNERHIRRETRERVVAVARALNYEPSLFAQTLRRRRSHTIGVLTERPLAYQWVAETVSGILDAAAAADVAALLLLTTGEADRTQACLTHLRRRHVEGFVYIGTGTPPPIRAWMAGWDVPHVYTFCDPRTIDAPAVLVDDAQGAALAVGHLIAAGRRHFALLCGPPWSGTAQARAAGARGALAAAGRPLAPERERVGTWDEAFGFAATTELLAGVSPIDAVIAANDFVALGAVHALEQPGRHVPDDVAVVGFDNHLVAELARPRLTSVAIPAYECGRRAAQYLLHAAERGSSGATPNVAASQDVAAAPPLIVRLPCQLVVRESSGA